MSSLEALQDKIANEAKIIQRISHWRLKNAKIIFTNGCFDILHRGHIEYLAKAASKGGKLIVGLNTDASVKRNKGEDRPLNDEYSRALSLSALGFVAGVVLFDEDTPIEIIKKIKPDVLVKGADYNIKNIVGADYVLATGGKVETIPLTEGYSTTELINKIKHT